MSSPTSRHAPLNRLKFLSLSQKACSLTRKTSIWLIRAQIIVCSLTLFLPHNKSCYFERNSVEEKQLCYETKLIAVTNCTKIWIKFWKYCEHELAWIRPKNSIFDVASSIRYQKNWSLLLKFWCTVFRITENHS